MISLSCFGCATTPPPFSIGNEVEGTTRGVALALQERAAHDDKLTPATRRTAVIARIATVLALGSFLYAQLEKGDQECIDRLANRILKDVETRSGTDQEPGQDVPPQPTKPAPTKPTQITGEQL